MLSPEVHQDSCSTSAHKSVISTSTFLYYHLDERFPILSSRRAHFEERSCIAVKQGFSLRSKRQIAPLSSQQAPSCLVISTSVLRGHRARRVEIFPHHQARFLPPVETTNSVSCHLDERPPRTSCPQGRNLPHHQARFLPPIETTDR